MFRGILWDAAPRVPFGRCWELVSASSHVAHCESDPHGLLMMSNGDPVDPLMADALQELAMEFGDVVRHVIQFLEEDNLDRSVKML